MQTKIISLSSDSAINEAIHCASRLIEEGEIIAFPTDTLYGVGCNVFNEKAVKRLFELKKREYTKPINVLIGSEEQLSIIANQIPEIMKKIMKEFWPGDLTVILHKKETIPSILTSGKNTVGIRMPNNQTVLKMISEIGKPLATTSANFSGKPSLTNAAQVLKQFQNKIPLILDGGETEIGKESTILSLVTSPPKIIRKGSLSLEKLLKIIPDLKK